MQRQLGTFDQRYRGQQAGDQMILSGHCGGLLVMLEQGLNVQGLVLQVKQDKCGYQENFSQTGKEEFFVSGQGGARAIRIKQQQLVQAQADGHPAGSKDDQVVAGDRHAHGQKRQQVMANKAVAVRVAMKIAERIAQYHKSDKTDQYQHGQRE